MSAKERTRKLSFSSEQAVVPRWFGGEILDHSPQSVRLDFINSGRAPLLVNHDTNAQPIGVIEAGSVKIGKDKIGRAEARFGKTGSAVDALTNVDDGIFANTSVGYRVHEMKFDSENADGEETFRVVDWEPHEVSLVGVPADRSVGIGRGNETDDANSSTRSLQMSDANAGAAGNAAANNGAAAEAARSAAAAGNGNGEARVEVTRHEGKSAAMLESQRVDVIKMWCKDHKMDERLERQWITSGASVETVASEVLRIVQKRGEVAPQSAAAIGLSEQEAKRFSVVRAIRAIADDDWKNAGFEAECSRTIAQKLGKLPDAKKFFVPYEVQQRQIDRRNIEQHARSNMTGARDNSMTRADVVGTTTAGGYLVETINLSFIELLRNRTVAFRLGATVLSGLVGNVNIPKQTGAATAFWLSSETTTITEVEQTFGQLGFSPHTVGGYTEISRLLLLQSSPDVEGIVNADLAAIVGIALDAGVINGSGSAGQPHGIVGLSGVGTGSVASTTLSTLTTVQGTVGAANVVPVRGGWATTFTVSAALRSRNEFANTYSPLWYGSVWEGMMLGYPGIASNQIPSGDLFFGDWAQVVVAEWGVLEVEVNPYANFQAGIIGVRAMMTVDVGVRYPAAFYVGTSFS